MIQELFKLIFMLVGYTLKALWETAVLLFNVTGGLIAGCLSMMGGLGVLIGMFILLAFLCS